MRSALGGAHRVGFTSGYSGSRADPASPARTPIPIAKRSALLKWLEMGMLRFDSACVCEQSYPYLLGNMHPSGRVRIQTMATARTQPRVIKAGEVVDPRRAAAPA